VAVKVLRKPVLQCVVDQEYESFLNEANIARAVRSEYLCGIHGTCELYGFPALVLEYFAGGSLVDALQLHRREQATGYVAHPNLATVEHRWHLAPQLARGLLALHSTGIVHRDIKPHNVLLTADYRRAVLADFGLARRSWWDSQSAGGRGTARYMAPEVLFEQYRPAADIFSLGLVLWELLYCEVCLKRMDGYQVMARRQRDLAAAQPGLAPRGVGLALGSRLAIPHFGELPPLQPQGSVSPCHCSGAEPPRLGAEPPKATATELAAMHSSARTAASFTEAEWRAVVDTVSMCWRMDARARPTAEILVERAVSTQPGGENIPPYTPAPNSAHGH